MTRFPQLKINATGNAPARLGHLGSIKDVLAARLPDSLTQIRFAATDYLYGFELASPAGPSSLGEALLINGICYATSTDTTSSDYNRTIHGPDFVTGGMFLFPRDAAPSHTVSFTASDSLLSLSDFYWEIYETTKQPTAFVGILDCACFHGTAIGKPPIDGKPIFEHKKEYFPHPEIQATDVTALVMGVFTDIEDSALYKVNGQLEAVLYKNPFDSDSLLSIHSHALALKHPVKRFEDIRPDLVDRALHLLISGTAIRSLNAHIFTIGEFVDYQNRE